MKLVIKKARDISKLVPEEITDKNGVHRTVYVNPEMPESNNANIAEQVRNAVSKVRNETKNHVPGRHIPLVKTPLGEVNPIIADKVFQTTGITITGFTHEITNDFIRHVIKNHGDVKRERERGNIPIKEEDFEKIPDILNKPDYVICGLKRGDSHKIVYVKEDGAGSMLYFEEILTGNKNKSLQSNTFYKTNKVLTREEIIGAIGRNVKTDVSQLQMIGGSSGGHPTQTPQELPGTTVTKSVLRPSTYKIYHFIYPVKVKKSLAGCGHKRQKMIKVMLIKMIRSKL